ncbi:thiol reductant ABC exporter subunit CydD [Nocardioides anomalus]|uniref:Thiol reductant ABC exporter subunit CydD n=1 Tax=Nocardioides anomalus TaxID=2712223 RepID=A0A6G6WAL3_9ACTN|nr:thiol reductant ABC exporter subunit CydD [Nocardioides anomalus]QIG42256.1 thiol reductant ABC exporter subunit CydD [Nocardioides anomalus]
MRPHLAVARLPLALVVAGQVVAGLLVVIQAYAAAWLVSGLLAGSGSWPRACALLVAALLGRALAGWVVDVAAAAAAARVGTALRARVLHAVLDDPAAARSPGEVTALATRGVAAVEPYLTRYVPALVTGAVLPVVTVAVLFRVDWIAGLVVAATLPLVPLFAALVGVETRRRAERQWRAMSGLAGHFVDVVRGLPTLVVHRRADAQAATIRKVTERYRRANRDLLRLAFASSAVLELVATLSVALVAVVVGLRLAAGGLDLRTALVVLLLAPEAYWPLRRVGAEFHAAAEGSATLAAIADLPPAGRRDGRHPSGGPLVLDDVTLTWPGRTTPAVTGLSAVLPERGLTVLTGASGCGKSTVLAALLGELTPTAGRVVAPPLDRIAHLRQRPWLADATVAENVRLGRPCATDAEVAAALATVGLALDPDLRLGEDGAGLSAGQRARLALARVLVSDRPYVLLDEPSAHLDADTEALVVDVVRDLARTRCVVAVAHRPALVEAADSVLALPAPAPSRPHPTADPRATATAPARADVPTRRVPWAAVWGLGVLASTSGVALTATAGWLIATAAERPPVLTLMVAIVGVRTFGLARPVLRWLERLLGHDRALHELAGRRAEVYAALVPLVPGRLGRRRGDLLASVVDDVDALLDERLRVRAPLWTWLGTTVLTATVAAWLDPRAGAVVLATTLLGGGAAWLTARAGARRTGERALAGRAALSRRVLELVTDARPLAQWQAGGRALGRVEREAMLHQAATRRRTRGLATARLAPAVATAAAVVGTALVAPPTPVGALLLLLPLALADVMAPLADAGALSHDTRAAVRRLDALTALEPAVTDPERPERPRGSSVELDAGCAHWPGGRGVGPVDLRLDEGASVAVVGPSGSGKSTLAAVLVRFLAPSRGRYTLGGASALTADDVRRRVGLLDDDPYLFASTLAENVRLARPDATDAEVADALERAHLGEWLASLPDGLATRLGDGAASVSGGERARIGLARLLLADHPVLVLDEPTAHLDAPTAQAVADDLLAERGRRSVVWITHDGVGLDRVDRVLDTGAGAREKVGV